MSSILLIDCASELAAPLTESLSPKGYDVLLASGLKSALELALTKGPLALVCDLARAHWDVGQLPVQLGAWPATSQLPILFLSEAATQVHSRRLLKPGDELLVHPVTWETLAAALERSFQERDRLGQQTAQLKHHCQAIIGATTQLAGLLNHRASPEAAAVPDRPGPSLMTVLEALHQRHEQGLLDIEVKYGELLDSIGIGIYRATGDADGRFLHANPALARMFGFDSVQELLAVPIADLYANRDERQEFVQEILREGMVKNRLVHMHCKNGDSLWVAVTAQVQTDEQGKVRCLEGVLTDITEHKRATEALARERDFLWALMDHLPEQIYFKDLDSRFTRINAQQARVLGLAQPDEAVGRTDFDFFDHARQAFADEQIIMQSRQPLINKLEYARTAEGEHRWVSTTKAPIIDKKGDVIGLVGVTRDVHEAKLAEQAQARRARLTALAADVGHALIEEAPLETNLQRCAEALVGHLDAALARIWLLNASNGRLELRASAGLNSSLTGPHACVSVGQGHIGLVAETKKPHLTNALAEDARLEDRAWIQHERLAAFAAYPLWLGERLLGVMAVFGRQPMLPDDHCALDSVAHHLALSIAQKHDATVLRQSEEQFRLITENAADLIAVVDAHGTRLYRSPSHDRVLGSGAPPLPAPDRFEEVHPEDRPKLLAACAESFRTGQSGSLAYRLRHRDGTWRHMECTVSVARNLQGEGENGVLVSRDITERKRAEAELENASRQAGMAEVASSVLHNVGNILNSVNTSANVIRERVRQTPVADMLKVAETLAQHRAGLAEFLSRDNRAEQLVAYLKRLANHLQEEQAALTGEVTDLAKNIDHIKDIVSMQQNYAKVSGVVERVQPAELMEDALRMHASALLRHDVQIVREYEDGVADITVDKHKVLQILVNLIHNAKHACDAAESIDKHLTVGIHSAGERVRLSVSDNGVGIAPENLERIFRHGFTTRKHGHGFGLHSGAIAARELGGTLKVQSPGLGQGATFILELPRVPQVEQP